MNRAGSAFALCLAAAAAMTAAFAPEIVATGIGRTDAVAALAAAAAAVAITGWAAQRSRAPGAALTAVTLWVFWMTALSTLVVQREAVTARLAGFGDDVGLGESAAVVSGGEVALTRRGDGHFSVPARVNEQEVRFLFDTGASSVVLSSETARRIGLKPETLSFRVPVSTANGRAMAAPVTLERLAVGPIVVKRVRALVAQPGLLEGNLLGQSFLDRLDSYEVRGNRLVLRARTT